MPKSRRTSAPPVRPLLVGEQNPYGGDPEYALYPAPDGCSGQRLCCLILGMRRKAYLESFRRVNLCDGTWDRSIAANRAGELRDSGGPLILLGRKVAASFDLGGFAPFTIVECGLFLLLPHPSGLCRQWNEPGAFERARTLVAEVCPELAHLLGVCDE